MGYKLLINGVFLGLITTTDPITIDPNFLGHPSGSTGGTQVGGFIFGVDVCWWWKKWKALWKLFDQNVRRV